VHRFANVYRTLKAAHIIMGRMSTTQLVEELRSNFGEYHQKYIEKREGLSFDKNGNPKDSWKDIPANTLAKDIYDAYISDTGDCNFKIIDFGCGLDGLFETELAGFVKEREAFGIVSVVALDVVKFRDAKALTDAGSKPEDGIDGVFTKFVCTTFACDYTDPTSNEDFKESFGATKFDAGVFCLALMADDALEKGLSIASVTVKPSGAIYFVFDLWKLDINPAAGKEIKKKKMEAWSVAFESLTGFRVVKHEFKGSPTMAYIQLTNIGLDESEGLKEKLQGITLKSLATFTTRSKGTEHHADQSASRQAGPSNHALGKRHHDDSSD